MLVAAVFPPRGFSFLGYFSMPPAFPYNLSWFLWTVKASISSELYPGNIHLLTFARLFTHKFVSFYRERYSFEQVILFYLALISHILAHFMIQICSMPALIDLPLPAGTYSRTTVDVVRSIK